MNRRLTTAIMVLLMTLATGSACADKDKDKDKDGQKGPNYSRMQKELGLTEVQVQKMRDIREAGGTRDELDAVLTDEQRAKSDELRKEHAAKSKKRMERLKKDLALTDAQATEIAAIRESRGGREAIRAVLTEEQRVKFDEMRKGKKGKKGGKGKKSKGKQAEAASAGSSGTAADEASSSEK